MRSRDEVSFGRGTTYKVLAPLAVFLLAGRWLAAIEVKASPSPDAAHGNCVTCHEIGKIATRPHGDKGFLTESSRCEVCHVPHGKGSAKLLKGLHIHSPVAGGACDSCHRTGAGRPGLRARGARLCQSCHPKLDGTTFATAESTHTALLDGPTGKAGCLSCHDPHVSSESKLLARPASSVCSTCHQKLADRGKAEPYCRLRRDQCGLCHTSHASDRSDLLLIDPSKLCATCHRPADATLVKKHIGADLRASNCLKCHSSHGDCKPKSLAKFVHPPVLDGCVSCHEGGDAKTLISGGGLDLCASCHDPVIQAASAFKFPHPALAAGSCKACHEPHAAPRQGLMKSPPESACAPCHPKQIASAGEVAHSAIELLGCEACHQPHGGNSKKFLRKTGAELCLSCHGAQAVEAAQGGPLKVFGRFEIPASEVAKIRVVALTDGGTKGHPILGHRTLGLPTSQELKNSVTGFSGELTCLSCHDPHKGVTRSRLVGGATGARELCQRCHKK